MEQTWKEAAQAGNTDAFYELFHQNPNLLEQIDNISFIDTPLHIAASAGKTDFALEVMSLKPSFSKKLNPDGLSPLHLALRNGHSRTAELLFKQDPEIVRVRGRGLISPLHYAAGADEFAELLDMFVSRCPDSVRDLTARGETAVHIAARKGQRRALKALLDCVERSKNEQILNWLDHLGYAALHIAAEDDDFEAVTMLLMKKVDINVKNEKGLKAIDITKNQRIIDVLSHEERSRTNSSKCENLLKKGLVRVFLGSRQEIKSMEQINALLVIAGLIATVTYQAILSPPSGFSSGDNNSSNPAAPLPMYTPGDRGKVQMDGEHFDIFMSVNTIAFLSSMTMIWLLLLKTNNNRLMKLSLTFLFASYGISLETIAPDSASLTYSVLFYGLMGVSFVIWGAPLVRKLWLWIRNCISKSVSGIPK